MNKPVLKVEKLSRSFETAAERLLILNELDLVVPEKNRVVILGESGCGKSTLLNIIGGLENPTSGSITAGPFQVECLDEAGLAQYRGTFVGLVFQFHYLLKDFSAVENVMLPAFMQGMKKRDALDRAKQLLHDVKLEHRMDHYPAQLSGGERQRAAVARALINQPSLVLADEPTGNLDPVNSETVMDVLFSVVSDYGSSLIMVTHDQSTATRADCAYRLVDGKLAPQ